MNNRIKLEYIRILKSKRIDNSRDINSLNNMWATNGTIVELEKGQMTRNQWDQNL